MAVMNEDMDGIVPYEGDWVNGTYYVCTSHSADPLRINPDGTTILESSDIADGPGHRGFINIEGTDE